MTLKKQFFVGVFYTAGAKYLNLVIQLIITGILSRLLTPDDFGVITIATVFIIFFNLLSEIGIGTAIIQNKTLSRSEITSIFSFSVYLGVILGLLFFLVSGFIADYYIRRELITVCRLLSIVVLFASLNVVPNALLLKDKKFKFMAVRALFIQLVAGTCGVIAAFYGLGVFALLIHSITAAVLLFTVNYANNPLRFMIIPAKAALRKIFHYSAYQFLFNVINYFSRNLDKLLIGKFLSPAALGYYDKAYRLMLLPIENMTNVLSPVIHPIFSDFQQDKRRIFDSYLKIVKVLALLGFPLGAFLHFAAGELILLIFGSQWHNAIPVFEVLAWSVGIQVVLSSAGPVFQAANSTKGLFIAGFLSSVCIVLGICYGVFISKSLIGTAYGLLIAFIVNFLLCYFLLSQTLHGNFLTFLRVLKIPILLFLLVLTTELAFRNLIVANDIFVSLVLKSLLAFIAVVIGIFMTGEHRHFKSFYQSVVKNKADL